MTRCLLLLAVSTLVAFTSGCQCCNWFRSPTAAVPPVPACGVPPTTAAMPIAPVTPTPAMAPAPYGPGYVPPANGTPGSAVPVLPAPQGYAPAPST